MPEASTSGLNQAAMGYLRAGGREVAYAQGAPIVRQGEPGRAFYVVTEGEVEVRLACDGGRPLPLARLGVGASFGEMSLLTNEPVSADVVALGPARVLAYPAERFRTALAECEALRDAILVRLVNNLRGTSSEAWGFFQRAEVLRTLMQTRARAGPIVAESGTMRKVQRKIAELARSRGPMLITGEPGTGKLFAAGKIHEAADGGEAPLIVVDCTRLGESEASTILFGTSAQRGDSKSSAFAPHLFGALHLAEGGTLVLQNIDALDLASQEILSRCIEAQTAEDGQLSLQTRLIATTREDLAALVEAEQFVDALRERLSANGLPMPRLADRRRDILPLARHFLAERHQQPGADEPCFTTSAEHALLSSRYRYRNVAELREAVDLAVVVADGPEIRAEHIFTGPKGEGTSNEMDLSRFRFLRWLVARGGVEWLRGGTLVLFAGLVACLMASGSAAGRTANALTWGLWWPAIITLFLFAGRVWCAVCPLSTAGRLTRRVGGLDRPPAAWIKDHAGWLSALLFLAIVWAEHVFHMTEHPLATGILMLSLVAGAVAFCIVYQREVWCRYVCPLGGLAAGYQVPATLYVRANPNVCATQCTTHECFKGTESADGCSMFHHPLYAREAHYCKLCLACLDTCPHQSPRLYLRLLLQGIWRIGDLSPGLVPLALLVFFLALAMLASRGQTWISTSAGFTVAALVATGLAWALSLLLPRLVSLEPDASAVSRVAAALLVLGWGPLMAFHLVHVPGLTSLDIRVVEGSFLAPHFADAQLSLLAVFQLAAVCVAAILAGISLWRIHVHLGRQEIRPAPWGWRILVAIYAVYFLAAIALTLKGGT